VIVRPFEKRGRAHDEGELPCSASSGAAGLSPKTWRDNSKSRCWKVQCSCLLVHARKRPPHHTGRPTRVLSQIYDCGIWIQDWDQIAVIGFEQRPDEVRSSFSRLPPLPRERFCGTAGALARMVECNHFYFPWYFNDGLEAGEGARGPTKALA